MGTPTPNLGMIVPLIGGDAGPAFAQEINADLGIIDSAFGGVNTISVAGNANVTATAAQTQNVVQNLTGILTGNITYFLPAVGSFHAIENNTTGSFTLSVGCTAGSNTIQVPQGLSMWVWTDGTVIRTGAPQGYQVISTTVVSGATAQILLLPVNSFRLFRIQVIGLTVSGSNTQMGIYSSTDGGATFFTGASSYAWNATTAAIGTAVPASTGLSAASFIPFAPNLSPGSFSYSGLVEITPGGLNVFPCFRSSGFGITAANSFAQWAGSGILYSLLSTKVNAVTLNASPAYSATFILEGLP